MIILFKKKENMVKFFWQLASSEL